MIRPGEIQAIAGKEGVRDTQVEKDYVISWVISGIANNSFLKENLIFKGGTVLKKVYFPDYRFSEDLDFTFDGEHFDIEAIKKHFYDLMEWVYDESRITLSLAEDKQYETGNFNFYLYYTGPLGGGGARKSIKVDISQKELVYDGPLEKQVNSQYTDLEQGYYLIRCYSIGEIISEKLRSLMQRTAPRDIYDLWYLFEIENEHLENYSFSFKEKASYMGYDPKSLVEVINQKKKTFEKHWKTHLANQMKDLPEFKDVWRELGKHWRKLQESI